MNKQAEKAAVLQTYDSPDVPATPRPLFSGSRVIHKSPTNRRKRQENRQIPAAVGENAIKSTITNGGIHLTINNGTECTNRFSSHGADKKQ